MRVLKVALVIFGAVILLLAGSAAALLLVLDDQDYRRVAIDLVERATGRAVTIAGPFSFHVGLEPSLTASDVRVANAPWAAQPDLVRIGRLEVQVALRPLLSGTLLIPRLVVQDADFELESRADGTTNWVTPRPGGGLVPVLGTVALRNIAWHDLDRASGRQTSIALDHLTIEGVGNVARLDGEGTWDGRKIGAKGEFGTLAQALDPAKPFPVDLAVSLPALELAVHGTVADPVAGQGIDLRLRGQSGNIGELLALLHSDLPLTGRLDGEAKLGGELAALQLSDLHLSAVDDQGGEPSANLEVTGQIGTIRAGDAIPLEGIDCQVQLATSTAALSGWLKREVPDLGPVQGRFALTGSSRALKLADLDLQLGSADQLTIAATGAVNDIRLAPDLAVRGLDLRLVVKAPATAPFAKILDHPLPELGPVDGRFVLTGNAEGLKLADLDLRIGSADQLLIAATGAVNEIRLAPDLAVQGVGLRVEAKAPAMAPLAKVLDRSLPELGPVDGRFALTGNAEALKLADLDLRVGSADQLAIAATGAINEIRLAPDLVVQGIDLSVAAKAAATGPVAKLLDRSLPELGPVDGRFALTGNAEALKLTDLDVRVGGADQLTIAATGAVDEIRLRPELRVQGVDLRFQTKAPATAPLAKVLNQPLPELGPVDGRFTLAGTAEALKLADLDLRVGSADRLLIAATGAVDDIRLAPDPAVRGVDVRLEAKAASTAALAKALDRRLPELGALQASGRLTGGLERLDLEGVDLRAGPPERPVRATGRVDNVLFLGTARARATFESDLAPLLGWALDRRLPELGRVRATAELAKAGERVRIERLEVAAGDTDVLSAKVAGVSDDPQSGGRAGFDVEVAARDLTILGTMLDVPIPALGPFAFKGRLAGDLETSRLSGKVRLGRTEIDATVRGSFAGARPRISGELATPVLYLADFGIRPDGPWEQAQPAKGTPPVPAPAPTSLAALRRLDLSLSLRIDQLEGARLSIDRASLEVTLQDGMLRIESDSFDLSEGSAELEATLDTSADPPAITLSATANDLRLGDILAQLETDVPIQGELDLETALKSTGGSLPGLIAALDGEFGMAIERGRIDLRYLDLTGTDLLQWLFAGAALRSGTDLSCFVARFGIARGVATSRSLFMDTSLARSTGSGTLNLVDRTVDILVHPRPARAELVRLTTPYRIVGPLSSPSVEVSKLGLAGRAVGELALTPLNLLGSLTSLVSDWGRDRENPCLTWPQSGTTDVKPRPAPKQAAADAFPIEALPPAIYAATTGVHVRTGPGTTYPILDKLPKGTTVEVTGQTPAMDWYRIRLASGGDGYVSSDYFTKANWPAMQ